jgi:sugar phosphate isomerase/epimerase
MRISMSAGTLFTFPLERVFDMAKAAGFDGIELVINQDFQKVNARRLVARLAGTLPIISLHAPFFPLDGWGSPIDSVTRSVEIARDSGVALVNFHPPSWAGLQFKFWRWFYGIRDFQKEIGGERVKVTVENMPWTGRFKVNGYMLASTGRMLDFLESRNLYLTFDCTHMGSGKTGFINDFYDFYNSGRIRNIHFSDYGHGRQHLLPGHGVLPLTRFLNHLSSTEYNETLTLELSPHDLPEGEEVIVETLREILCYLRKETERTSEG